MTGAWVGLCCGGAVAWWVCEGVGVCGGDVGGLSGAGDGVFVCVGVRVGVCVVWADGGCG